MAQPLSIFMNTLKYELRNRAIPVSTLASIADISSGKLSSYLNGQTRCSNEHELKLRNGWTRLKRLIEFSAPLPLNYTRADELQDCIYLMESGELQIVVFRTSDKIESAEVRIQE
jgi:hypothetical protein